MKEGGISLFDTVQRKRAMGLRERRDLWCFRNQRHFRRVGSGAEGRGNGHCHWRKTNDADNRI